MAQAPPAPPRPYLDAVCKPPTPRAGDVVPPCVSAEVTEALCFPNGTAPLHLEAHAQCMCRGSYFAESSACRACLSLHGLLPGPDRAAAAVSAASSALCGFLLDHPASAAAPPPSAPFRDLLASAEAGLFGSAGAGAPGAVAPGAGDGAPWRTEVSLYYTPSGPQGPGPITGSAALASATGLQFATGRPPTSGVAAATSRPPAVPTLAPTTPSVISAAPTGSGVGSVAGGALPASRAVVGSRPRKDRVLLVLVGIWVVAASIV